MVTDTIWIAMKKIMLKKPTSQIYAEGGILEHIYVVLSTKESIPRTRASQFF